MSINQQQIAQAIRQIEDQLAILKQAIGEPSTAPEGIVGVFDGEFMVEENGKRHQVPPNYASKTMLVAGDTIRMIEDKDGGQTKYKQIGKAERLKTSGILVKKDGKYEVLADEGSFKVLSASIKHYNGEVGDQVFIQYPKQHVKGSWAAVEKVVNQAITPSPTIAIPEINPVLVAPRASESIAQPIVHQQQASAPSSAASTVAEPQPTTASDRSKPKSSAAPKSKKSANASSNKASTQSRPVNSGNGQIKKSQDNVTPVQSSPNPESNPVNIESFGEDDLI